MKIIFDIGGTHMRFAHIVDGAISDILKKETPHDVESGKKAIVECIRTLARADEIESIVGGMAGMIRDGVIINSPNLPEWNGFDFQDFLKEEFCQKSFIYNDADLAGLGESVYGAGRGAHIVAYIGLGTGVGGTRIVDGHIDANHSGFEPGHHIIDASTGATFEGRVSGTAITKEYGQKPENVGENIFAKLAPTLAVGLYNVLVFWSPDMLILGGSLMNEENGFTTSDIAHALGTIHTQVKDLPSIKRAELGDSSGLWGAVAMSK
jgi:predicted NBD/HSP70 family sugar kinase